MAGLSLRPSVSIIIDLQHLDDAYGVSMPFWLPDVPTRSGIRHVGDPPVTDGDGCPGRKLR